MFTLTFKQHESNPISYDALVNGEYVDGIHMDYSRRYTQAHIVLASVYNSLKSHDVEIIIESNNPELCYPVDELVAMALVFSEDFVDNYGVTRTYSALSIERDRKVFDDFYKANIEDTWLETQRAKEGGSIS